MQLNSVIEFAVELSAGRMEAGRRGKQIIEDSFRSVL